VSTLGTTTFPSSLAGDLNKCFRIIPQRVKKNNFSTTWFN
jgi:hypothetical protein